MDLLLGVWDLQSLTINGLDTTQAVKSQTCYKKWDFEEDSKGGFSINESLIDTACRVYGSYRLKDNNKYLELEFQNYNTTFVPVGAYRADGTLDWTVRLISKENLVLDIVYNGEFNEMWLKKN